MKGGVTPGTTPRGDVSVMSHMTASTVGGGVNETPQSLRRDQFGLNNSVAAGAGEDFSDTASFASFASSVRSSAKEQRRAAKKARLDLANALAALPTPQFEYEIAAPKDEDDEGAGGEAVDMEEDQEDVERREAEIKRLEAEMEVRKAVEVW